MESYANKEKQPAFEVVAATPGDAEGIQQVLYETWLATYPNEEAGITVDDIEESYKDRLSPERIQRSREILEKESHTERRFVAKAEGKVIGVSRVLKRVDRNKLQTLYVLPDYQGKGVGTALWDADRSFFDPSKDTYLEVAEYNDRAIEFYKRLGFTDTGKRIRDERFRMKSGSIVPEMEMRRAAERPGPVSLHRASETELETLIDIERSVPKMKTYSPMVSEKAWRKELETCEVYLIEYESVPVGSIAYELKEPGHVYVSGVIVKPEYQGRGIATYALQQMLDAYADADRIDLVTHPENPALKLYESLGFTVECRKENYYGDGEPRLVLARTRYEKD